MKIARWIALLVMLGATGAEAGSIAGHVNAQGPAAPAGAADGAYASLQFKFAEKVDYDHFRDFVVYIDQVVPGTEGQVTTGAAVTQRNMDFDTHVGSEHHVLPVAVGSKVKWPNADEIFHNVFSYSEPNQFDLGMYAKGDGPEVTFDKVGEVDVFCAIHSKMHCIVLVLPNRCFAVTNARGRYQIENVPAGTYQIKAWHERMPVAVKTVVVPGDGVAAVDFTLSLSGLSKP